MVCCQSSGEFFVGFIANVSTLTEGAWMRWITNTWQYNTFWLDIIGQFHGLDNNHTESGLIKNGHMQNVLGSCTAISHNNNLIKNPVLSAQFVLI